MTAVRVITADDVCLAVEAVLLEGLPGVIEVLGYDLKPVTTWEQVPSLRALTSANFPTGCITSGGLVGLPERKGDGTYDATWRIAVGVWDRDSSYRMTTRRARQFAAAVRTTLLRKRSLGDFKADSLAWVSETYDEISDRGSARTIGGAVCGFNVGVKNAIDPYSLDPLLPIVSTTNTPVTVRNPEE